MFAKNLKYLRKKYDMDQIELANKLGRKSTSTISEWEKGKYTPKAGTLSDIAQIFNIKIDDLMRKDIEKFDENNGEYVNNVKKFNIKDIKQVPVVGRTIFQEPILNKKNIIEYRETLVKRTTTDNIFYLKANDSSMSPMIPQNSYVLILNKAKVKSGDIAGVLIESTKETMLRTINYQNDSIITSPQNNKFKPIILNKDYPGKIIGKAVRLTKEL